MNCFFIKTKKYYSYLLSVDVIRWMCILMIVVSCFFRYSKNQITPRCYILFYLNFWKGSLRIKSSFGKVRFYVVLKDDIWVKYYLNIYLFFKFIFGLLLLGSLFPWSTVFAMALLLLLLWLLLQGERQFTFAHIVAGSVGREEQVGPVVDLLRLLDESHVPGSLRPVGLRLQFSTAAARFARPLAKILAKH